MFIRQPTPGPNPPSARFQFRESTHARPARLIRTDDEQWRFPWLAYALGSLFGSSCSCLWLGLACNRRTRSSTTQVSTGLSKYAITRTLISPRELLPQVTTFM